MAKARLISIAMLASSALCGASHAQGVWTGGSAYAYAPYLSSAPTPYGSLSFSFNNAGSAGQGAGVFWNYGGSISLWMAPLGDLVGNGGLWTRPTLQLQSPSGDTRFITAAPPIFLDGRDHIVSVAYGMETFPGRNNIRARMIWGIDGQTFDSETDGRVTPIEYPAYVFRPSLNNGWGWFAGWPADGQALWGAVNFNPHDYAAFVNGVSNQNNGVNPYANPAVWLRGSADNWYNQLGADIAFEAQGFVTIEDIITWP